MVSDTLGIAGKKFAVLGVANEKSIGWGIANALHANGAELAFSYVNGAIERRVRPLAASIGCQRVFPCDVASDESIDAFFSSVKDSLGTIDGIVHSVAYADKGDLGAPFHKTSRSGFSLALDISAYSLIGVVRAALPLMVNGGSVVTLSYLGAERVVPNYNVMGVAKAALEASVRYLAADLGASGVRVNAVSAGPIRTLAASGIPQFRELLDAFVARAPLRRNVTLEDVASSALYLLSPMGSGVTGETLYVDGGFNIVAM